jgi:hypothetical protein
VKDEAARGTRLGGAQWSLISDRRRKLRTMTRADGAGWPWGLIGSAPSTGGHQLRRSRQRDKLTPPQTGACMDHPWDGVGRMCTFCETDECSDETTWFIRTAATHQGLYRAFCSRPEPAHEGRGRAGRPNQCQLGGGYDTYHGVARARNISHGARRVRHTGSRGRRSAKRCGRFRAVVV